MRPVTPEHIGVVLALLDDVAKWMLAKGVQQWESPPPQWVRDLIAEEIPKGNVFLAWLDGAVVGTVRLDWQKDAMWPTEREAGYVYTLAVHPSQHGKRIGEAMLSWAAQRIRERGKRWMRLDCIASNQALRDYYSGQGFAFLGVVLDVGFEWALFEKEIKDW
ncbi:MAG: GNAT family N-acetyltransferase [Anaerolineae bacterium]|nr:GNAT family N-acetyltransferase [Anaerolineae bacterium]